MVRLENDCVGCPQGCIHCSKGDSYYYAMYCDECGRSVEDLFLYGDKQICNDCLVDHYEKVDISSFLD